MANTPNRGPSDARDQTDQAKSHLQQAGTHAKEAASSAATGVAQKAQDTASGLADRAKDAASNLGDKARDAASNLTDKAKGMASNLGDKAGDLAHTAQDKTDDALSSVGGRMASMAGSLRQSAPREGMIGSAAGSVADTLESSGRYLQQHGVGDITEDLAGAIRRNPVPALCIAFGLGFLIGMAGRRA
jgi:hypothetical protein